MEEYRESCVRKYTIDCPILTELGINFVNAVVRSDIQQHFPVSLMNEAGNQCGVGNITEIPDYINKSTRSPSFKIIYSHKMKFFKHFKKCFYCYVQKLTQNTTFPHYLEHWSSFSPVLIVPHLMHQSVICEKAHACI